VTRGVIVDCDNALGVPGRDVDDGLALLFLLSQPGLALRGVTTVFGNAGIGAVTRATRRLLALAGAADLPLAVGAGRPGTGETAAARFLLRATAAEPGALTILALGPPTNLAAAAALDPGFFGRCAGILCLGGSLGPARHGWRRLRELNFEADPAAARAVLATRDCPVTVVPATSCVELTLRAADLPALPPPLRRPVRNWLMCCRIGRGLDHMVAWDLVPALALTYPALLRIGPGEVTLGDRGVIAAQPAGPHRLVHGLADPLAARAAVLAALGGRI
jgi:purine nucleosidase